MRRQQSGIIFESFKPVSNSDIEILENTKMGNSPKAKFKVRLQTLEEKNNNGRYYDKSIGKEIVETLRPKAKARSLFQEVDHPMVPSDGDQMFARKRAVTVELKNCGAIINDLYVDGNDIVGEAETLSGFLGPDLYNTIVYDKADIGFSLRMFGRVQMDESTGLNRVVRPIRPITYDVVTNPSHGTARILEFVTEDISSFLVENDELMYEGISLPEDINLFDCNESVYDYLDNLLNNTFKSIGPVEFRL